MLTIRHFGERDGLGLLVRVWLGFALGFSVGAIDYLSEYCKHITYSIRRIAVELFDSVRLRRPVTGVLLESTD